MPLQPSQLIYLSGLYITSLTFNAGLLKFVPEKKTGIAYLLPLILNSILSVVGAIFIYKIVGATINVAIYVGYNFSSFLILQYFHKSQSQTDYALDVGERLLSELKKIDFQISKIMDDMVTGKNKDYPFRGVRRSLRFILSELPNLIGLDGRDRTQLCLLVPNDFKFTVVAWKSIDDFKIEEIESKFAYGQEPQSIAGHSMNTRSAIIVNDLSNDDDPKVRLWIRTVPDEEKTGSVLAYPILLRSRHEAVDPIAILCIATEKTNAFEDEKSLMRILDFFSVKIEILQHCYDLTNSSLMGVQSDDTREKDNHEN